MWTANYSSSRMIAPCVQAALSRAFSLGFMSGTNAVIITESEFGKSAERDYPAAIAIFSLNDWQ